MSRVLWGEPVCHLRAVHPTSSLHSRESACAQWRGLRSDPPPSSSGSRIPAQRKEPPVPGEAPLRRVTPTAPAHLLLLHWRLTAGGTEGGVGWWGLASPPPALKEGEVCPCPLRPGRLWLPAGQRCGMLPGVSQAAAEHGKAHPRCLMPPRLRRRPASSMPQAVQHRSKYIHIHHLHGQARCVQAELGLSDPVQAPAAQRTEGPSSSLSSANTMWKM